MERKISSTGGIPYQLIPLILIILINGIKDYLEDFKRKRFDSEENDREVNVYDYEKKAFVKKYAQDIKLGNIIKAY